MRTATLNLTLDPEGLSAAFAYNLEVAGTLTLFLVRRTTEK